MTDYDFGREPATTFDFNPNKIAPSLSAAKLSDISDPDSSWLMDENTYLDEVDGRTGLTGLQTQFLVRKVEADYGRAQSYWCSIYEAMRTDWKFYGARDQWTEEAKALRAGRPVLTIPIISKFVKRVVAETKKNPPAVKLNAREDGDVVKADIGMGLVRYIEDVNGAKYAYAHALECAAVGGIGWIRGGYDQRRGEIKISKVKDAFRYYIDPDSQETDGSDATFYVCRYRKTRNGKTQDCYEYWWKEWSEDGLSEEVYWALVEGSCVMDYGRFPGSIIPIFPVFGEDMEYEGERVVKGMVRDLEDAQRFYNYMKSQEAETIAFTPKPSVMAEEGTIPKEYEKAWRDAPKKPGQILKYRSTNLSGDPTSNKPEYVSMKADAEWTQAAATGAVNDLKEVTGIYDTALGSDSKELSGKAIIAKQITADAGQFTYTEHLQATIQQVGRWLLQMIPFVYGNRRVLRILGEDGRMQTVNLDAPMGVNTPMEAQEPILDLDFSEMDLSVASGTSYATRREAGVDAFQSIMQAIPETATAIADLAVKNMDVPWAREASERLHAMLPQAVKDAERAPRGFVPAHQLQEAMRMFDETKAANMQIQQQMQARITALEAELKNQIQGKIAAERIKGEYALANTQVKEMNANSREAMKVQADVEKSSAKIQTDLIREVGARSKAIADAAKYDSGRSVAEGKAEESYSSPQGGQDQSITMRFKEPVLDNSEMTKEDMLLNL